MNVAVAVSDLDYEALAPASEAGPAPKRIVVAYGFWVFLLSDIVMFSALFASYAVLVRASAGGPSGAQLFNQVSVAIETVPAPASKLTAPPDPVNVVRSTLPVPVKSTLPPISDMAPVTV